MFQRTWLSLLQIFLAVLLLDRHLSVDLVDLELLLIGDGLLARDPLGLNADDLDQLVGLLVLLVQLDLLGGQLLLQVVHLKQETESVHTKCRKKTFS